MTIGTLFFGNDHKVSLVGLKDAAGTTVTGAAVEVSVLNKGRTPVSGATWPMAMIEGDPGDYSVAFDKAVEIAVGARYIISVTAVSGGKNAQWDIGTTCEYRTA